MLVVGLVGGISGWQTVQKWGDKLLQLPQQISDEWITQYPPQLVVHWENETLTLEPAPTQPVVVGWPKALEFAAWKGPLAVYTPQSNTNPAELTKDLAQPPLFVVDQKQLWSSGPNDQWSQSMPLNELPFLSSLPVQNWDRAAFIEYLGQWVSETRHGLRVGLFIWPVLTIGFHLLGRTCFVLMESTVIWAVSHLLGWHLSWKKLIKFVFIVVPTADVISWIGHLIYPNLTWSLFQPAFWVLITYLSLQSRKQMLGSIPQAKV